MNKNQRKLEEDLRTATRSYYSCLKGTIVQITRLERYITRFAIGILALTLVLVLIKG
jgi:hypothetical protein